MYRRGLVGRDGGEGLRRGNARGFVEAHNSKYSWDFTVETLVALGPVFAVRPRKVLGFDDFPDEFPGSATRWTFE